MFLTACQEQRTEPPSKDTELEFRKGNIDDAQVKWTNTEYFKQNVSFFDARIRSINEISYVREIYFLNLGDEASRMPSQINFQEVEFLDDGTGNDLVSGDGIYTSVQVFHHDDRIRFDETELIRSVLEKPIVNPEFIQSDLLLDNVANYELRRGQFEFRGIEITCDIEFGTTGCLAQKWGWCKKCCIAIYTDTCSITIGF